MQGSLETWWCFLELLLARSTSDLALGDQLVHGRRESLVGFVLLASLAYGHSVVFLGGQPHWCYGLLPLPDRSRARAYPCGCGPWSQSLYRFRGSSWWDSGCFYGHRYGWRDGRSRNRQFRFFLLRRILERNFVLCFENLESLVQISKCVGPLVLVDDGVHLVPEFYVYENVGVLLCESLCGLDITFVLEIVVRCVDLVGNVVR